MIANIKCPACRMPMREDQRYVQFMSGSSPAYALNIKVRAIWCSDPRCDTTTIEEIKIKTTKRPFNP